MGILNYTTKVDVPKTIAELQTRLSRQGARRVSVEYDHEGAPDAIFFTIDLDGSPMSFRLPRNTEGVLESLKKSKAEARYRTREHATKVSWRILKDWIIAQLAIVETQQAEMAQVFMPYALVEDGGNTMLFSRMRAERINHLRLGGGK